MDGIGMDGWGLFLAYVFGIWGVGIVLTHRWPRLPAFWLGLLMVGWPVWLILVVWLTISLFPVVALLGGCWIVGKFFLDKSSESMRD